MFRELMMESTQMALPTWYCLVLVVVKEMERVAVG